jgi:molybdopterin synthase sulfur carrier subunit
MRIKVRFYGSLYELLNTREVDLELPDGSSLRTLIEVINSKLNPNFSRTLLDERGGIRGSYVILLNGSAVRDDPLDKVKLNNGDVVAFLPTAVGGKRLKPCKSL